MLEQSTIRAGGGHCNQLRKRRAWARRRRRQFDLVDDNDVGVRQCAQPPLSGGSFIRLPGVGKVRPPQLSPGKGFSRSKKDDVHHVLLPTSDSGVEGAWPEPPHRISGDAKEAVEGIGWAGRTKPFMCRQTRHDHQDRPPSQSGLQLRWPRTDTLAQYLLTVALRSVGQTTPSKAARRQRFDHTPLFFQRCTRLDHKILQTGDGNRHHPWTRLGFMHGTLSRRRLGRLIGRRVHGARAALPGEDHAHRTDRCGGPAPVPQHSTASTASAGRITHMLGMALSDAGISRAGASARSLPMPMESWLKTNFTGRPIQRSHAHRGSARSLKKAR